MRRTACTISLVTLVWAMLVGGTAFAQESPRPAGEDREFVPGQLIVKLEAGEGQEDLERLNRANRAATEEELSRRSRLSVVDLPAGLPVEEAVRRYEVAPEVEYAEPDYILYPAATSPNDPSYSKLWGMHNTGQTGGASDADIDAPQAWDASTGVSDTAVAVIDTGVDVGHPDLDGNVWTNPGESGGGKETNRVDDDGNGYVDDVHGWDFFHGDNTVFDAADGDQHGTHVAGTIAAEGNNGAGVAGVNWRAKVIPLKFLGPDGGSTSGAVKALDYAVARGAKVSNNSWGGGGFSQALKDAISRADAAGHIFVAAAGNNNANNDATGSYPANYDVPNVVSVAATDSKDALASFSNYGASTVDLAAPGVSIYSTLPGNTYGSYSGTSMATPHVAGVAALIKSKYPALDDAGIKARLLDSVDKKSNLSGKTATGGRLNAAGALAATSSALPADDTTPPTVGGRSPASGATGVRIASNVTAAFSEEMDPATLDGTTVRLVRSGATTPISATVRCDSTCKTVTLDPASSLAKRTRYEARITTGAMDKAGNALTADVAWTFTTGRR